jgi:hypothetical protein
VRRYPDCNYDALFPVDATSSEVAKPFLRLVFLAVTRAVNETWTKQKSGQVVSRFFGFFVWG